MPLTTKGKEILANLEKEYGPEKAKQVLYAGKNAGTFTGIDDDTIPAGLDAICDTLKTMCDEVMDLKTRVDAFCARRDQLRGKGGAIGK